MMIWTSGFCACVALNAAQARDWMECVVLLVCSAMIYALKSTT